MDGRRPERVIIQHANCGFRAYTSLGSIPAVGLGNKRQRAGADLAEALRLGVRTKWPYPPNHTKDRRQYHFSYRYVNGLPTASSRQRSFGGPDESSSRKIA